MAEPTQMVISCLMASEKPQTAQDIQKATRLPLPIVTRMLQTLANESLPSVERLEENGQIAYRFIGLSADAEKKVANAAPAAPARKARTNLKAVPAAPKSRKAEPEKKDAPAKKAGTVKKAEAAKKSAPAKPAKPSAKAAAPTPAKAAPAPVPAPRPQLKVVTAKKPPAAPAGPDYRAVYRKIAEHVSVPHNLSRLANATGLDKTTLQTALDTLVEAELVVRKEVPEFNDQVYRAVGDLAAAVETAPLPQVNVDPIAAPEMALELSQNDALLELQDCMSELKARLADESVAIEALSRAEALVEELRAETQTIISLREAAQAAIERFESLMSERQN